MRRVHLRDGSTDGSVEVDFARILATRQAEAQLNYYHTVGRGKD